MESWAIVVLTAALVIATFLYQRDTHRMADEMRRARGAQVIPRLVLVPRPLGAGNTFWRVVNVGIGPALRVDVRITPEPGGISRRWISPVVVPGETHDFIPWSTEEDKDRDLVNIDNAIELFSYLRLSGTCRDALGEVHEIDERVDIREWWNELRISNETVPHDWPEEAARTLDKIHKELQSIARNLERGL